jgi:cytochrome c biogenesis protein CcdA
MLLTHASVAYDIGFATPFVLLAVIIVGVVLFTRRRGRS